jgi:hypothetical protein
MSDISFIRSPLETRLDPCYLPGIRLTLVKRSSIAHLSLTLSLPISLCYLPIAHLLLAHFSLITHYSTIATY